MAKASITGSRASKIAIDPRLIFCLNIPTNDNCCGKICPPVRLGTWLSWLERTVHIREVGGSNPSVPTILKIISITFVIGFLVVYGFTRSFSTPVSRLLLPSPTVEPEPTIGFSPSLTPLPTPTGVRNKVDNKMDFAAQAPFGDWKDSRQQDGCEEASSYIAVQWGKGLGLTGETMLEKVLDISSYLQEKYGESRDTSARDTVDRIIKGYFSYPSVEYLEDVSLDQIIDILYSGSVIIAPMNDRLLNNPNFTAPGPERHMLVVKGYDPVKKEFITNDPGTRQGKAYVYPQDILYNAIRDYSTGYHIPINGIKKNIIVVSRLSS